METDKTNREDLVKRLEELHEAAWREYDLVKRVALENEWNKVRAELTRLDKEAT